jgi:hypothetical protein
MEAAMRDRAPNTSEFALLLAKGLLWGGVAATAAMCGALLVAAVLSPVYANPIVFVMVALYTAVAALILAFIHTPIAALLAWPLYRRNIRERAAYAVAGAVAALPMPVAFQLAEANVILIAWFAISGAFGGFMAARAMRQETS